MHHGGENGDEDDVEQAGADHDLGAHAQDVEHRGYENKATAHAHQHGQRACNHSQDQRRERRDVEPGTIEPPAPRQCGDQRMVAAATGRRGSGPAPDRLPRLTRHQGPDRAQKDDVERVDDDIDLSHGAEKAEQQRA